MLNTILKKTGFLLSVMALSILGLSLGYSSQSGLSIGSTATAQQDDCVYFYHYCTNNYYDPCEACGFCVRRDGSLGPEICGDLAACCAQ